MTYPLFFDIETVPMSTEEKPMTDEQIKKTIEKYGEKLNFMPEFNKILVISYGVVEGSEFVIKSITGDEHDIITVFFHVLDTYKEGNIQLIGHNIKGFDIPFIAKRAMYNGIKIHPMLKAFGKKPWEIDYILDTCEVYKHFSF